ncbi:CHASE2 domain-containing protein [Thermomonas sp.]|uniref:CHASE2 domain-containing protein n=1 Tax=Thermomonas sp. TaxID=1971895 RepID=UPI002BE1A4C7|nr:CHASE2 domain-containing protein [Thermomonas sp.]HRO63611.1 CHASE2 domain-containing protein [Thermomonas sp.]
MARKKFIRRLLDHFDAAMASLAVWFMDTWSLVERGYRRPLTRLALRLKFLFYPLLAVVALGWLGWDYSHGNSLSAAEDSVFDTIVRWRPAEPKPSGKTVVVEIDDCSLEWTRAQGVGGWPWPRSIHADLLDALDRAGVKAVGYDIQFIDRNPNDPDGDGMLDALAGGGQGRFLFASARQAAGYDAASPLHAAQVPGAFPLGPQAESPGPKIAVLLPYGDAMARYSALTNVSRGEDGILRDVPLREDSGDWGLPTLPLRIASRLQHRAPASYPASVRVNWREHTRMPYISAADLLSGERVCGDKKATPPALRGAVVLVGYTASGISDSKPTPLNSAMPGVEVWAEATDALLHNSAIWMPPTEFKYLLAALLVMLTAYAFWRGEPHEDMDAIFVAVNGLILLIAFIGLTYFGIFLDIFVTIGFVSMCFGLCRTYAALQRGRAIGNNDYREEYDPDKYPCMAMARLRFVGNPELDAFAGVRGRREYRRLLRRQLYGGGDAVMIEGIVERKSWLHEILDDLMVLVWTGTDHANVMATAKRELDLLYRNLNEGDLRLEDYGRVMVCISVAEIDDDDDSTSRGERLRLRELLGQDLNNNDESPLVASNAFIIASAHTLEFNDEPSDNEEEP